MKKLFRNLMAMTAFASMMFMYSCGEDDTETPDPVAAPSATVSFYINGEASSSTAAAMVGDTIKADVAITAEGNFNVMRVFVEKDASVIYTMELARTGITGVTDFTDLDLPGVQVLEIPDSLASSELTLSWEVVDDENQVVSSTTDFVVTVEDPVDEFETVLIGGFNSETLGSSYDAVSDSVYFASNLRNNAANQAKIDFVYYFADTPQRTIAAPNNDAAQITWEAQNTSSWPFGTTENATTFQVAAASFDFDMATSSSDLENAYSEVDAELERVTDLSVDDVVIFKLDDTRGGKYGAFKVTAVDGNSSGSITLTVKIQK